MAATIHRFRSRPDQLKDEQARKLREGLTQLALDLDLPEGPLGRILSAIDARTASQSGWTFIMLSPHQNAAVVQYLGQHSKRPMLAMRLWSLLFTAMRNDTGEICLNRSELAEALGVASRTVSEIMTELAEINAVVRKREGRRVRYFMNPNVATTRTGQKRDEAQRDAGQLSILDVIDGGKAPANP